MNEFTLYGMRVVSSPLVTRQPRMQVSAAFARIQSPELVASTNAWMLGFFGTYMPAYIVNDGTIYVDVESYNKLLPQALGAWMFS